MKTRIDASIQDDKFVHSFNAVQVRDDFIRSQRYQKTSNRWLLLALIGLAALVIIIILAALIGAI